MKKALSSKISLLFLSTILFACSEEQANTSVPEQIRNDSETEDKLVGSDRDEHGCIGSAGYQWCAALSKCVRPWELAENQGFENTPESFKNFCEKPDK